jgi:hypothetical protein
MLGRETHSLTINKYLPIHTPLPSFRYLPLNIAYFYIFFYTTQQPKAQMNSEQFREAAHSAIDQGSTAPPPHSLHATYQRKLTFSSATTTVIDYYENISDHRVVSAVSPGYLRPLLPSNIPEIGEPWEDIQKDITEHIIPGLTHWYRP